MFVPAVPDRRSVRRLAALGLACTVVFFSQLISHRWQPVSGELLPITRADSPDDRLALTYDLTWGEGELAQILQALAAANVRATFFVGYHWAAMHPTRLQAMVAAGHEIGTLGMHMSDPTQLAPLELNQHLRASQSLLERTIRRPARWYRPFGGKYTDGLIRTALGSRLNVVTWSLDGHDGVTPAPPVAKIAGRVARLAGRGDIVRLHASEFASSTGEATAALLAGLQQKGYRLVTISQLIPGE